MQGTQQDTVIDPGLVRAKAYEIWQSRGCPEGAAEQTWFEAERQLRSRLIETQRGTNSTSSDSGVSAKAQTSHDSEPLPASDPMNHDRDSETMATATGKPKKSAGSAKRSGRR